MIFILTTNEGNDSAAMAAEERKQVEVGEFKLKSPLNSPLKLKLFNFNSREARALHFQLPSTLPQLYSQDMPRIAILSDVHACEDSLRTVIAEIQEQEIPTIYCLGDLVGYGPDPAVCVTLIRSHCAQTVMGNHDAMAVAQGFPLGDFPDAIAKPLVLAREQLDADALAWLADLPLVTSGEDFVACHASLDEPAVFTHIKSQREIDRHFRNQSTPLSFFGHTHIPTVYHRKPNGTLRHARGTGSLRLSAPGQFAVGVGSVGFPRDGDGRACWVEWDSESLTLTFHRTDVDRRGRQERLSSLLNA